MLICEISSFVNFKEADHLKCVPFMEGFSFFIHCSAVVFSEKKEICNGVFGSSTVSDLKAGLSSRKASLEVFTKVISMFLFLLIFVIKSFLRFPSCRFFLIIYLVNFSFLSFFNSVYYYYYYFKK